jgi:leucyl/phenylalanyl-tRNA--protein transferase
MGKASTVPRRLLQHSAFTALRWVLSGVDPGKIGRWAEVLAGRLGCFEAPDPVTVISNYLRGFVLFGKANTYGARFNWLRFPTRAIITAKTAHIPKKLRRLQRRGELEVRYDQDFEEIIHLCQQGRDGWLTPALVDVYREVEKLGFVATVGTYRDGRLVGGFWGIEVARAFGIMSMFHLETSAGSVAVAALVDDLAHERRWSIVDFGMQRPAWEKYGAREIPVQEFSELLIRNLSKMPPSASAEMLPKLEEASYAAVDDSKYAGPW